MCGVDVPGRDVLCRVIAVKIRLCVVKLVVTFRHIAVVRNYSKGDFAQIKPLDGRFGVLDDN
jgi:hypothetical protein